MPSSNKRSFAIVIFTIGLDALGFGIMIPLLPQLLTDPSSPHFLLSPTTSANTQYLLIGFLSATYPIMQFFSAPVLGQLSDRYGRRPVLVTSLAGTVVGYVLFAFGVMTKNIPLLFVSRAIDGLTGGNMSVAHAVIADITDAKERTKSFGVAMGAFGIGLVTGPVLGGTLADHSLSSWFDAATPFWFAALFAALNTLSVWWLLDETHTKRSREPLQPLQNLKHLVRVYARPQLRGIFGAWFFLATSNSVFVAFFGVFLIRRFGFDQSQIARFFGFTGLLMIFTQLVTLRALAKRFSEVSVLRVSILAAALVGASYLLPTSPWWILVIAPLLSTFNGLSSVNMSGLLSRTASADEQGEVLGISGSIQALGWAVPPLLAGSVAGVIGPDGIILACACTDAIGWLVFIVFHRERAGSARHSGSEPPHHA